MNTRIVVTGMGCISPLGNDVPRYYLHIDELDTDPEGAELAGIDAARHEAILAAREMLAEGIGAGRDAVPAAKQ